VSAAGRLLAATLAAVLVVSAVPLPAVAQQGAVVVGNPELTVSVPDNRVSPGETVTLEAFVVNDGNIVRGGPQQYVDRVTTARATTVSVGQVPGLDVQTGSVPLGRVGEGIHGPVPIEVTVPETVPPGSYRLPVTVSYTHTVAVAYDPQNLDAEPEYNDRTVTEETSVRVVVEEQARFRVTGVESATQVGDSGTMTVAVTNVGSEPVREASVRLTSANEDLRFGNGSGAESAESFAGDWDVGETRTLAFPVRFADDAEERDYTVTGVVTYTDPDGIVRTSNELRASVRPLAEQSFSLSGVASSLRVNHEGEVTGRVTNDGPAPARDVVVRFDSSSETLSATEREYALPDLAPGESAAFAFDVEASSAADPGARQLRFVVAYETEDGDARTSDPLAARVEVGPERDPFRVDLERGTVAAGENDRLVLTVTNTEDEPLTDVSAKLFVDDPVSTGDDEAFVSRIDPGESVEMSFDVGVAGGTFPKDYPVAVDFEFDRPDGTTEVSDTYRVPVTVVEDGGDGLPLSVLVAAGLVVAGVVAVVIVRRRG
jgi:hypothetical protein